MVVVRTEAVAVTDDGFLWRVRSHLRFYRGANRGDEDSAKLTALLPLLSWLSEPMETSCDLSVWPLLSLVSSLL